MISGRTGGRFQIRLHPCFNNRKDFYLSGESPRICRRQAKTISCLSYAVGFNLSLCSILARENWRGIRVSVS